MRFRNSVIISAYLNKRKFHNYIKAVLCAFFDEVIISIIKCKNVTKKYECQFISKVITANVSERNAEYLVDIKF